MRTLGKNMAWLLKPIQAGKLAGITLPEKEPRAITNFIRYYHWVNFIIGS